MRRVFRVIVVVSLLGVAVRGSVGAQEERAEGGVGVRRDGASAALERRIAAAAHRSQLEAGASGLSSAAVGGRLQATDTVRIFPVISRIQGQAGSNWRTRLNILNPNEAAVTVLAQWYPANSGGLPGAAATAALEIEPGRTEIIADAVADLFGADGNGAVILTAAEPFAAAAHVFNDQRANPQIGGTFGLFVAALAPEQLLDAGLLLLGSNRAASSGTGFRSNVVVFNPNPFPVSITFAALSAAGELLGRDTRTLEPYMNAVEAVFRLVPSVPSDERSRDDLTLAFSATAPVAVALTPVDNATNDGFYVLPSSGVIAGLDPGSGANRAPNGTIVAPVGDLTIQEGQSVFFEGQASDPDGDALSYSWDFGDTISSTALIPGNHTYTDSGTYTVTLTVTDSEGLSDPSPATRTITVEGGGGGEEATFSAVQQQIFSASCAFSGCHAGGAPAEGLNLSEGQAYAEIVNVRSSQQAGRDRIEPGSPSTSYLYLKILGDASISGSRMPRGAPALSQALKDLLRDWIERGAPND
jgi:hypothetical protein